MRKRKRPRLKKLSLALLLLFAIAFVGFVIFAVLSERRRVESMAAIAMPPEAVRHNLLAEVLDAKKERSDADIPPELAPSLAAIARWTALFKRMETEVDGDEWDKIIDFWQASDGWESLSADKQSQVLTFLDSRTEFIAALREVAALGGPVQVYTLPIPPNPAPKHLTPLQDASRLLRIDAIARARTGDVPQAVEDCIATIQLFDALSTEPWSLAQSFRYMYSRSSCLAITGAFNPGLLSTEDTARLIHAIQATAGRETLVLGLRDTATGSNAEFNALLSKNWTERGADMWKLFRLIDDDISTRGILYAYASPLGKPWLNQDIAQSSELMSRAIAVAHLPYHEAMKQYDDTIVGFSPYARLMDIMPTSYFRSQADHEARLQLLQIGLTLEQVQFSQGHVPPGLDALSAHLTQSVFIDPFTGEPFIYIPGDDTFLLYSVGRNLTDDGGTHDINNGDIVWRGTP